MEGGNLDRLENDDDVGSSSQKCTRPADKLSVEKPKENVQNPFK